MTSESTNINVDAVLDDLSAQLATALKDNAVLRGVVASLEATVIELQQHSSTH